MALQAPDMGMEMGIFQVPSMICLGGMEPSKLETLELDQHKR